MEINFPNGWTLNDPITQRMLEAFERAFQDAHTTGRHNHRGATVRAAIESGWFKTSPTVDDVNDKLSPKDINAVSVALDLIYADLGAISENLS